MRIVRGSLILLVSLVAIGFEIFVLIIRKPLNSNGAIDTLTYYALVGPALLITFLIFGTAAWVGYTIIKTPGPVRLSYEQAYEQAVEKEGFG